MKWLRRPACPETNPMSGAMFAPDTAWNPQADRPVRDIHFVGGKAVVAGRGRDRRIIRGQAIFIHGENEKISPYPEYGNIVAARIGGDQPALVATDDQRILGGQRIDAASRSQAAGRVCPRRGQAPAEVAGEDDDAVASDRPQLPVGDWGQVVRRRWQGKGCGVAAASVVSPISLCPGCGGPPGRVRPWYGWMHGQWRRLRSSPGPSVGGQ